LLKYQTLPRLQLYHALGVCVWHKDIVCLCRYSVTLLILEFLLSSNMSTR